MGSLTAPPGSPASSDAAAEQALFMEARRRRRRRWLAGIGAALVAAAVLAVSAVTWLPRAFGQHAGPTGAAGAALVGRSSVPAGHARFTYQVVTAGVPEAYGTKDITFAGNNRSLSFSQHSAATGPQRAQVYSGTERLVDGQVYVLDRIHGRPTWVHEPLQVYANPKIIDPRRLLRVLAPYARFQASGYQVIGGVRLKVLRATDPDRARALGRTRVHPHLGLVNYTSNLRRLGWTDDDLSGSGSDALIDALVAHGTPAEIAAQLTRHLDAGAGHVCLHLITEEGTDPLPGYRALAPALGLS